MPLKSGRIIGVAAGDGGSIKGDRCIQNKSYT